MRAMPELSVALSVQRRAAEVGAGAFCVPVTAGSTTGAVVSTWSPM